MEERKGEIEVELAQKRMTQEQLVERVREKYTVNLHEVRGDCVTINITDNGQTVTETVTAEEMAGDAPPTDWECRFGREPRRWKSGPANRRPST